MTWPSAHDENVEKERTLVRTDHYLGIRMTAEELNMDKEMVRQILTTNLNMKKVCTKMDPKESASS
jgi:GTP-binding protein EngB required for normal cell division